MTGERQHLTTRCSPSGGVSFADPLSVVCCGVADGTTPPRASDGHGGMIVVDLQRWYIVVNGPPASGKFTVAPWLASHFALPLIANDALKDALMSVLAVPDVEASRQLGRAAIRAMLALAAASPIGAVLESNFNRLRAGDELRALPGEVLEVFCRCDREVAARRYRPGRHSSCRARCRWVSRFGIDGA